MSNLLNISRFRTLFIAALATGAFFLLGTASAFAAAGDHNVTGGNTVGGDATIPNVGAASEALATITVASNGGDDIADTEVMKISINTAQYPSVVFDNTVTTATIAGTFGATAHTGALVYNAARTEVTLTLTTGGGDDANLETVTVAGLKVGSIYATNDPGAPQALIQVECETTANDAFRTTSNGIQAAVAVGALTSTTLTPDTYATGTLTSYTIAFNTSAIPGSNALPNGGKIVLTFPSGYDVSSVNGTTAQSLSGLDGTWTAAVSGQIVTLTQAGGGATAPGAKSLKLTNVRNPQTAGTTGTFTLLTEIAAGNDVQTVTPAGLAIATASNSASTFNDVTNVAVTDYEGGVRITWDDPSADDTSSIQILRGVDPLPVSGTVYATVITGVEYYVDTDVEEGDVVTYQLRPTDGTDTGDLTEEVTITVGASGSTDDSTDDTSDDTTDDSTDDSTDDTTDDSDDSTDEEDEVMEFSDVDGHWAEWEINVMTAAGVVEGNPDGTFDPDGNLNRAEAATLLWRVLMMGDPSEASEDPFSDVDMDEWYAAYIAGLKDLDLVDGNPDGTYEPSEDINRAEFLQLALNVYLYYYADMEASAEEIMEGDATDAYEDLDTSAWYEGTVTVATEWGFVEGSDCEGGKCFNAGNSITRAEATKILYNMFN